MKKLVENKLSKVKKYIRRFINRTINLSTKKEINLLTFIPHGGCEKDGLNFMNYKSDSALTFFHYIVHEHGNKYKYQIASGENEKDYLQRKVKELYPNLDIVMISHPLIRGSNFNLCKSLSKSHYIFTSQALPLDYFVSKHNIYFLGYYAGNFKNDLIEKYEVVAEWYNRTYSGFFSPSLLFSQINSLVYDVPISKFHITGLIRNDNLFDPYDCPELDRWISSSVDYEVKKVFLYTPTHRDYEEKSTVKRSILGFDINSDELECFLKEKKIVIIVKIHSHQNIEALSKELPKGILLHQASQTYGLNELLQRSAYLITDYTSTYFDYLLIDKPVLFNFYDFEIYEKNRGFSFDPILPILAGEQFIDQRSMIEKIQSIMREDRFKEKRSFVRDMLFKYKDNKSAERVYNYIFNAKETSH